jgi:hypothetical protein
MTFGTKTIPRNNSTKTFSALDNYITKFPFNILRICQAFSRGRFRRRPPGLIDGAVSNMKKGAAAQPGISYSQPMQQPLSFHPAGRGCMIFFHPVGRDA